jgi:hypothetical protein
MERRLAAILAADVVGYSRHIRADEEGTLAARQQLRAHDAKTLAHAGDRTMTDEPTPEMKARIDSLTGSITEVTKGEHPEVIFSSLMSALANFLAHIDDLDAALGDLRDGLPELESLTKRIRAKLDTGEEKEIYTDAKPN